MGGVQLYVEKEGILLAFSPSGVRTPQRPQPAGNGRPAVEAEPYWEGALAFTRAHCLQREVEVEVCARSPWDPSISVVSAGRECKHR